MTIRSHGPRFAQSNPNPAGQVFHRNLPDFSRFTGGGESSNLGVALPVPPQTFCVFDGIPDPTVSTLGMTCGTVTAASDDTLKTNIKSYFRDRGASDTALADRRIPAQITVLVARLRYECTLLALIGNLGTRAQNAEGQVAALQGQVSSANTRAQNAEGQVAALQGQVTDLTNQLQSAVAPSDSEIRNHIQQLESDLAIARQKLGGVTPAGVLVGGVVGAVGTYFATRKRA